MADLANGQISFSSSPCPFCYGWFPWSPQQSWGLLWRPAQQRQQSVWLDGELLWGWGWDLVTVIAWSGSRAEPQYSACMPLPVSGALPLPADIHMAASALPAEINLTLPHPPSSPRPLLPPPPPSPPPSAFPPCSKTAGFLCFW